MKAIFFLLISLSSSAQIVFNEGSFNFLKNVSAVSVEFKYDSLTLTKDSLQEAQYVEERVKRLNTKYGAGRGEVWEQEWLSGKNSIWEPRFLEILGRTYKTKSKTVFEKGLKNTPYILVVDVRWINPGWDVYVAGNITRLSAILTIVEAANRSNVLTKTIISNVEGSHKGLTNFHGNEIRIGIAYARLTSAYGRRMKQKDPLFKTTKF